LKRRLFRRLSGNTASALIRLKLGYPVTDSQCGAKLFVLKEIQQYFREPFQTKWLFDAELFLRILRKESRAGMKKRVCEIPVTFWSDVPGSKVRPIQAGLQLFRFLFL